VRRRGNLPNQFLQGQQFVAGKNALNRRAQARCRRADNPLHDIGYPGIGCKPCTQAVKEGEDDRAGRWSNFAKMECGLHTR